ncbi:Hypothetical predicted protein [Octopus vulgaris]|uniref:Uncharacterized protein n=1 Tax=Octopus vulgaris TaxID=6645 RepID=A0AA36FFF5_OCTVU|nr:Hypothetical predicted protein [Octopus vulgaris]
MMVGAVFNPCPSPQLRQKYLKQKTKKKLNEDNQISSVCSKDVRKLLFFGAKWQSAAGSVKAAIVCQSSDKLSCSVHILLQHVCMHAHKHAYTHTHTALHRPAPFLLNTHTHTHTHKAHKHIHTTKLYLNAHIKKNTYMCTHTCTWTHAYIHMHTYSCIYTHTHMQIHVYTYIILLVNC